MLSQEVIKVYDQYGRAVVAEARSLLISQKGLSSSSNLVRSLNYKIVPGGDPKIVFEFAEYGKYVRRGRKAGSGKYKGGRSGAKLRDFVENLKQRYKVDTSHGYAIAITILKKGISQDIPPFDFLTMARKKVKFPIAEYAKAVRKSLLDTIKK